MMEKVETGTRLTVEEFLEIAERPEYAGYRLELIDGEVYMTAAFLNHGEIAAFILVKLGSFVYEYRLGRVIAAETGIQLGPGSLIAPDVGFFSRERAPERLPSSYDYPHAPDLIVEVVSKSNSATEIQAKLNKYFAHGCKMAWIVYPSIQHVWVYTPNEDGSMTLRDLGPEETLIGGDVVPGFTLPVRSIFEDATA
jgi:Uma2 family endonuclease